MFGRDQWGIGPAVVLGRRTEKTIVGVFGQYYFGTGSSGDSDEVRGFALGSFGVLYLLNKLYGGPGGMELVKYDLNGNQQWVKKYTRGEPYTLGNLVVDGSAVYAAGTEYSGASASTDFMTLKFSSDAP